jgi:hypothetical protein
MDAVNSLKNVKILDIYEFIAVDPKLLSFHNVNTQPDLNRLMENIDDKNGP